MITEDYVSFETAKLLKEKGFDEPCESAYTKEGQYLLSCYNGIAGRRIKNSEALNFSYSVVSPTLQMAMKWMREEEHLYIMLDFERPSCIEYKIYKYKSEIARRNLLHFSYEDSYEQACEAAIKYCLKNLI